MIYDFQSIEKKWQEKWQNSPLGLTKPVGSGKKFYCLDMFPYPSGSGLHVGHWRGYVLSDVYTRIKWLEGYNILHPMGWDAFGLPAENDAIKKGINPTQSTSVNIANFKKQLKDISALYDWSKEINTTDPQYYKWTQWIFIQMFKAGLAYESEVAINWCPSCLTGLANEEVVGEVCERCQTPIEQKKIRQWMLKITAYAEKLLEDLDKLCWPEKVKNMQRNWIGKSVGVQVIFKAQTSNNILLNLPVFTTRIDTIYGTTFIALSSESEFIDLLITSDKKHDYELFIKSINIGNKSKDLNEKNGFFTGSYAFHPLTNQKIPIFIATYILNYGTGIVMGVPAHDQRDFEFAKKYNLPLIQVISDTNNTNSSSIDQAYEGDGILINSECFNGIEAKTHGACEIFSRLEQDNLAKKLVTYKLRDWIFSRQRYWGEPIPLIHCVTCGIVPVPESQLPVELPKVENYQPTGTGESPLALIESWVNTKCPVCFGPAKRETNTMPQWAGSSWYFLRYPNPHLNDKPWESSEINYWLPVDLYVGGIEHAILHLLYARFYVKFLHDRGYLSFDEPFLKLFNQGMVTKYSEKSGLIEKMSKSKGNVVNPDDIVKEYGRDVMRMYILFMGPPELDCQWQDSGLEGIKRFLVRLWHFLTNPNTQVLDVKENIISTRRLHQFIKAFQDRIDNFKPNTAISAFMEFLNDAQEHNMSFSLSNLEKICTILSCMAPAMASELLDLILNKSLSDCQWPIYDTNLAGMENVTIAIQVNGKLRGTIVLPSGNGQEKVEVNAKQEIKKWLENKSILKVIYIKDKLINFIIN